MYGTYELSACSLLFRGARFFDDFVKQRLISTINEERAQVQAVKARYVCESVLPSIRLQTCARLTIATYTIRTSI